MITAQATQMETRVCQGCNGEREVDGEPCCAGPTSSCGCGGRMCGFRVERCPVCKGTGVEVMTCEDCGEPATMRYLAKDLCDACKPSEEELFDHCSICGRDLDCSELSVPLCSRCDGTARAAGQYARDAARYPDPERRAS